MRYFSLKFGLFVFAAVSLAAPSWANSGAKALPEGVNYIAVSPPLIVNYGGPGKMRYIKAELSIRAENSHDATEITHHLPLVRDRLITILSAQTEEEISTPQGKEDLRLLALGEINKVIHAIEAGTELPAIALATSEEGHGKDDEHAPAKEHKAADSHAKEETKETAKSHGAEAEHHADGPATDLLFNNFVVQK
jgi:flagellar protein FliL